MVYSSESARGPMSQPPIAPGESLALAAAERYRLRKFAAFAFVIVCVVLAGLITVAVLTQPGGGALVPLYGVIALLFLPFFLFASRQRAALYANGLVPPHRRLGEFLGGQRFFVPFREIDRVMFVRNEIAPSQLLYAAVFLNSGRRERLYPDEVGREFLQRLVEIAEGRAIPGITLRHEYRSEKW
jgi:hypothetical protein